MKKGKPKDFCQKTCFLKECTPSALPSAAPSAPPSAAPSTSPSVEGQCEDNSTVRFEVPKTNGGKKVTKCKNIKKKDCSTAFAFQKEVGGMKKGKPKDFCQKTCFLKECTPSAAPSAAPSAPPSAAPSTSPSVERQCEDNPTVQ